MFQAIKAVNNALIGQKVEKINLKKYKFFQKFREVSSQS